MIELITIEKNHADFIKTYELYNLKLFWISGDKKISLNQHKSFFYNHPYRYWFFIKKKANFIGSVYVHFDNSIGFNLIEGNESEVENTLRAILTKINPLEPIQSVRNSHFIVNAPSRNMRLIEALEKFGAKQIQKTYRIE